jgi:hypothetical protein
MGQDQVQAKVARDDPIANRRTGSEESSKTPGRHPRNAGSIRMTVGTERAAVNILLASVGRGPDRR